ncbi:MAG: RND transporter [Fibrobacter sp.]|nr:RND transporter [Fibrobacter sp.]
MFSIAAKILKRATRHPVLILVVSLVLAALSIIPVSNLRWELQLQDAISPTDSKLLNFQDIEKEFGGLGSLTVVLQSPDSSANYNTAKKLAAELQGDSLIHFLEFETDIEFYQKHNLLYIEEADLDTIARRIDALKEKVILKNNPLYVSLEDSSKNSSIDSTSAKTSELFDLNDLEKKYYSILSQSHANASGTIRVIDIYPRKPLTDLQASRDLLSKVKNFFEANKSDIQVYYTGKVYDIVQTGRTLLPEAKLAGKITALFILLLFVIHFYRQPGLIVISAIPAGLPILYTLALAGIFYGRINIFTLLLALLLPGGACQAIIHFLNRYFIERSQKLGPQLSIESAVLGIGPSTAASTGIMAALFACLIFVPMQGIHELGVLGFFGSILNWIVSILATTSLLSLFQRKKAFPVGNIQLNKEYKFTLISYRANGILIAIISVISFVFIVYGSLNLKFFYDFSSTELQRENSTADSLILQTGFPNYDPIIVKLPSEEAGEELYQNFRRLKAKGALPNIDRIYTLAQFSPKNQTSKQEKLNAIQESLSPEILQRLDSMELLNAQKISQILYRHNFDEDEQPENIRNKFSNIHGEAGKFAFIFSSIDPDDGLECRHLTKDLKKIDGFENGEYSVAGTSVLRAQFLDLVLANLDKTIFVGSVLVWLLLLLFYNRLSRAIFTALPSLFAMSWLLILIRIFGIELSVYSSLAFPILIGASVDGSLQLWNAFYEKESGTALTVLQRKFSSIGISQMASLIGSYGLLISSHPGLRSIGQISLIGLLCIFVAQFTIFPLIAGSLDNYRLRKKAKKLKT